MHLIIDIGNTNSKVAVVNKANCFLTIGQYERLNKDVLKLLIAQYHPAAAIFSSVREFTGNEEWFGFLKEEVKNVIHFTSKTPIPVKNLYGTPDTLGCDRLAAAVGVNYLFPSSDCMVIDCGTAITVDFIGHGGEFLGGNISPGLQTRFKALNAFTDQLPLCHITDNVQTIGTTTDTAISSGVLQGAIYEIERYIEQNPHYNVIFTGGDALFFAKHIKNSIFVVFNLVFIGLNRVLSYNAYYT
jgi:type III pantothenate kinase